MPDEEKGGKPEGRASADTPMHIVDMPYVQYLTVWDDQGAPVTIDNSADGMVVPAAQVQTVYDAAFEAGILVEEVTT